MCTLLTIKQQNEWVQNNNTSFKHKWSCNGMGNSKIVNAFNDEVISKAGGCGYDRFGTVMGDMIMKLFPNEVLKLVKRECKERINKHHKGSATYSGLFYNTYEKHAYLDGACGQSSMERILKKIGFKFRYMGKQDNGNTGVEFYQIVPLRD